MIKELKDTFFFEEKLFMKTIGFSQPYRSCGGDMKP
jgi:hypothetical protein